MSDLTELPPLTELGELVLPELLDLAPIGDEQIDAEEKDHIKPH